VLDLIREKIVSHYMANHGKVHWEAVKMDSLVFTGHYRCWLSL
jgi:hypothetical protein